jgi:hypothetical protein
MSVFGGPDIVTDGLVLHLDAANRKSYPGSGTSWNDLVGDHNVNLSASTLNSISHSSTNKGYFNFTNNNYYNITYTGGWEDGNSLLIAFRPTENPAGFYKTIFNKGSSLNIRFVTTGQLEYTYKVSGGGVANAYYSGIERDNWYIIQTSADGVSTNSRAMFYVNGYRHTNKYVGRTGYYGGYLVETSTPISLGATSTGTAPLAMNLGFVLMYDRHLSHEETLQNYNALKGRFGL